jgi:hypothetical protein
VVRVETTIFFIIFLIITTINSNIQHVAPSCWNHTVTCVFPTKFLCMLYVPVALKTSSLLSLLCTTQHKNVSLLCWTLYSGTVSCKRNTS